LHGSTVSEAFHDALEAAGLPGVRFHSGVAAGTVAELVGHSSVRLVLEQYGRHVAAPQVREAVQALSDRLVAV
jgi:integrase